MLSSLINVRYKGVKIVQIESLKISKADRIKKLNFENKYLYGSSIKAKDEKTEGLLIDSDESKNDKDLSSEIYWTCLHVPEVLDFSKPKKKKQVKSKAKTKSKSLSSDEPEDEPVDLNVPKKGKAKNPKKQTLKENSVTNESNKLSTEIVKKSKKEPVESPKKKATKKIVIIPELPYTLTQLSSALPSSASIKKTTKQKSNDSDSDEDSSDDSNEREIPFGSQQLRAIPNFPLNLQNSKAISSFENFVAESKSVSLPSVSKVLQGTMPESQRAALIKWKSVQIAELGLEGFELMQKSHLSRGKEFHKCLQNHFRGESVDKAGMLPEIAEIWKSIEPLLGNFDAPGVLIEDRVKHPYLLYQGIVDCVSYHNSSLCVIEWKKSDRLKKSINFTYDAPIQLSSYLGALNASRKEFKDNPIRSGVVVVAYNDGQKADLFELNENDLKKYWKLWLHRLQEYWVRYKDNTLPDEI